MLLEGVDVGCPICEGRRAGGEGACHCRADDVERVAEQCRLALDLVDHFLEALEKGDRDRAADATTVKRQDSLGAGPEQMTIARRRRRIWTGHRVFFRPIEPRGTRAWYG